MTIFTAESLAIYQKGLATNRGNGYLEPFAIGNPYSSSQDEIFPSHDCNNTFGGQQVLHDPPSNPPQEESGQFPFSSIENPNTRSRSARIPGPPQPARALRLRGLHDRAELPVDLRRRQDPRGAAGPLIGFGLPTGR